MKKILALILVLSSLLCLASCAGGGDGAETTDNHTHSNETSKKDPEKKPESVQLDNELVKDGSVNFNVSDYRVVDALDKDEEIAEIKKIAEKAEAGHVIIRMDKYGVIGIHKVIEFKTNEDALEFLVKITKDGTAKNYPELGQIGNCFYYTIQRDDPTYGKFAMMTREQILEAFGRTATAETDADGHQH